MGLELDLTNVEKFLKIDYKKYDKKIKEIHQMIHNKTGLGNDYLGWIDLPYHYDKEELKRIESLKEKNKDLEVLVVIGIGGSYLGSKAGLEFVKKPFTKEKTEIIFAGHQLSGEYLYHLVEYLKDKNYAINVISKSGTTTEPAVAFRILKKEIEEKYGKAEAKNRIFVTTDKKRGALFTQATNEGYEKFIIPDSVGGRYSVLTAVGLLPFVFAGLDVKSMLEGAQKAFDDANSDDIKNNLAYQYALTRYLLNQENNKKIEMLINYEPKLNFFSEWWKQLFGESEGKENKGLFVASASFTTDLHSLGQYIQEGQRTLFETVLKVKNNDKDLSIPKDKDDLDELNYISNKSLSYVNNKALLGTMIAHVSGNVPNILLTIDKLDTYHFGYLVYFFEIACAMSAYLLEINPFNQPGVEAYKKNMFALLGKKGYENILK
ncbi:Glucose-6-phosphate isomerase [Alteracholeplasma palmae J233]|uniref:Glucose-6-phosphate isomerase n=2 Tax=Acholeplasma palmae TaxID=38986 RepID=U4KJK9_ALTPJ|nr:glucose-6-phosphate isomerase [Alteracholeplasma palmae]CCV63694.1 Glucose-6-phosphate isomerase [Alteracholeplasma palmae J233]